MRAPSPRLRAALRVVLSVSLLGAVLVWADLSAVGRTLFSVDLAGLGAVLVLVNTDRVLMAWKWWRLLESRATGIGLGEAVRAYYVATFAGMFLPMTIGADVVRAAVVRRPGQGSNVVSSIVLERGIGAIAQCALAAWSVLLVLRLGARIGSPALVWTVAGLLFLSVASLPLSFMVLAPLGRRLAGRPGLAGLLGKVAGAYAEFASVPRVLVSFSLWTALETLFPPVIYFVAARSLGFDEPFLLFLATIPLVFLVARLPVSLGGIGVLEGSFVVLAGSLGMDANHAVSVALLAQAALLVSVLPGALVWVRVEPGDRPR